MSKIIIIPFQLGGQYLEPEEEGSVVGMVSCESPFVVIIGTTHLQKRAETGSPNQNKSPRFSYGRILTRHRRYYP